MDTISAYLHQDHRCCDSQYDRAESAVAGQQWLAAHAHFSLFLQMFERHLDKEERVLFPRLDHALGNAYGATVVMRAEHNQMRGLFEHMRGAIARRDTDGFFDHADALRVLMRQHNLKEEGVLYPQADRLLHGQTAELIARMAGLDGAPIAPIPAALDGALVPAGSAA